MKHCCYLCDSRNMVSRMITGMLLCELCRKQWKCGYPDPVDQSSFSL